MVVPEKPTSRALRGDLTPPQGFEPLLNSREAAALLRMHHKTLERWARRNQVPGYRYNGRWYFRASELDAWLRSAVGEQATAVWSIYSRRNRGLRPSS
jgi:excisionase family DNA binding protein